MGFGKYSELFGKLGSSFRLPNANEYTCYVAYCPSGASKLLAQVSNDAELGWRQKTAQSQWTARFYRSSLTREIGYDPLIGKLIAFGDNRNAAIRNLLEAIKRFDITGIETTLPFGKFVCEHPNFISGQFDTHFIEKYFTPERINETYAEDALLASKIALNLFLQDKEKVKFMGV